jgi:AGZA family xanthine/uracil permease-like MFS transporter
MNSSGKALPEMLITVALGNGFIVTAMLWGGFLAELIDRKFRASAMYLGLLAVLAFFGVVHSASPDGAMYFPWDLSGLARAIPYQFASAYGGLALLLLLLSRTKEAGMPAEGPAH